MHNTNKIFDSLLIVQRNNLICNGLVLIYVYISIVWVGVSKPIFVLLRK